jgi:hypothetical protein
MFLESTTQAGKIQHLGEITILPFAKTLRINFPAPNVIFFWTRPTAILYRTPDGAERIFPIRDITRKAQLFLLGFGLVGSILIRLIYKKYR